MMKCLKKFSFNFTTIILLAVLFFLGCSSNQSQKTAIIENDLNKLDYSSYCAIEKTIENRIYFNYPQIKDGDDAEKINNIIVEFVENALQEYIRDGFYGDIKSFPELWEWDNEEYTLQAMDIDYKITRNDSDYLSITFEGLYNYKSAAHPIHYFDALIIDLKQCKQISLSDLYVIDSGFLQLVQQEAYYNIDEKIKSEYADQYVETIKKSLAENNANIVAFLTEESLEISINVGYAFGDHYEITIDYNELYEFVK